jgi:type I site-specific restriction endonuclease
MCVQVCAEVLSLTSAMKSLNLPPYETKLRRAGEQSQIFDEVRRKWVAITPEEWVRQHFVHYLKNNKHVPFGLIAVELGLEIYGLKRRADIVCYNSGGTPSLIVECKAPEIKLNTAVFAQAAMYNIRLKVPYLVVTNGLQHFCAKINVQVGDYEFISEIPDFSILNEKQ